MPEKPRKESQVGRARSSSLWSILECVSIQRSQLVQLCLPLLPQPRLLEDGEWCCVFLGVENPRTWLQLWTRSDRARWTQKSQELAGHVYCCWLGSDWPNVCAALHGQRLSRLVKEPARALSHSHFISQTFCFLLQVNSKVLFLGDCPALPQYPSVLP